MCSIPVALLAFYTHSNIWKYCADFGTYEKEFILVKDYVKNYMEGRSAVLSISFSEENKYDLYDSEKGVYLECPEEIKEALKTISLHAFSHKDSQFEWIYCNKNEIAFQISSGPYKLAYSPDDKPTIETYTSSDVVLRKKIKSGWYHVTVWSWQQ